MHHEVIEAKPRHRHARVHLVDEAKRLCRTVRVPHLPEAVEASSNVLSLRLVIRHQCAQS